MKSDLRSPEMNLKLAVLSGCLRVAVLGQPPLSEKASGVVAII